MLYHFGYVAKWMFASYTIKFFVHGSVFAYELALTNQETPTPKNCAWIMSFNFLFISPWISLIFY